MDRRSKTYLILATVVALLAICVAVWALFFRAPETPADPEISPVADEHLTPTDDGDDEKMPQAEGGGAVNITYSNEVTISLTDATAAVQITNPTRSNQSMLIQLMIQDVKVGQSGTIPPGNQLTVIPLDENITLEPGKCKAGEEKNTEGPKDAEPAPETAPQEEPAEAVKEAASPVPAESATVEEDTDGAGK